MDWHGIALIAAGIVGSGVALVHGRLTMTLMVRPLGEALSDGGVSVAARKLVPPLLHFSTFNWFVGGLALIAAALWLGTEGRFVAGMLAGSSYLYGAVINFWATRGRHPGWALYAIAIALVALSIGRGDGS